MLELVEGGDLLEHILKTERGLEEMNARDITYQMCDALSVSRDTNEKMIYLVNCTTVHPL